MFHLNTVCSIVHASIRAFRSKPLDTSLLLTDFSVLPGNAPDDLLTAPTATAPVFMAIAISFSILFFITFTLITLRHKMTPKVASILEKPMLQRLSAWVGFFGFLVGTQSSLSEMYILDHLNPPPPSSRTHGFSYYSHVVWKGCRWL